jgi:hypothetical protein
MNIMLTIAGTLSAMAAILHIACIYFGAPWYRLLGAGEHMAKLAEQGSLIPTAITSAIVLVLFIWSLYAFSAAGLIGRLPLMHLALTMITSIYVFRGIAGFFLMANPIGRTPEFWLWSSAISLSLGIIHLIGLKQQWSSL